jgi:diguanylate cyclase (GGDEF)-like protein
MVEHNPAAMLLLDRFGVVVFANTAATRLLGEGLIGITLARRLSPAMQEPFEAYLAALASHRSVADTSSIVATTAPAEGAAASLEIHGVNALEEAGVEGLILTLVDAGIWIQRVDELVAKGNLDPLTGLPNRMLFTDRLRQLARIGQGGAVALADLDGFKQVNDAHGHALGDVILQHVARRLVELFPDPVTVSRLGGDEFGLLFPLATPEESRLALERSLAAFAGHFESGGLAIRLPTLSVGVTRIGPQSAEDSLRDADVAMYVAKSRGRNQVVAFGEDIRRVRSDRREMAAALSLLQERNEKLQKDVRTDGLTGLLNRRALAEIEREDFGSGAWGVGAVLFFDLDHFGSYNHAYGDAAGDRALKAVADALGQSCRDTDLVFRKGGEEFVIVLPEVEFGEALAAAERMRAAIAGLRIPHSGAPKGVLTATGGLSCGASGRTVGQCLAEAGDLVMAAKREDQRGQLRVQGR